jgi:hypothetical protein
LRALSRHSAREVDGPTLTPKRNGFTSGLRDNRGGGDGAPDRGG